jgi:hypothetical protein
MPTPANSVACMPIGYLITAALVVWCTLMALTPPRRPLPVGFVAYLYGFVLNELPFLAFYYLVVATLLAATQSELNSPVGWAGIVLSSIATIGLILVTRRALRTGPVLNRALAEGLGEGLGAETALRPRLRLSSRLRRSRTGPDPDSPQAGHER